MRTFAVLFVFFASLLGLGATLKAEANSSITIEQGSISEPVAMPGTELAKKGHDDRKRPDGGDDEESEEELFPAADDSATALQVLDPDVLRMHIAARIR